MNHVAILDLIEMWSAKLPAARRKGLAEVLAVTERIRVLALRLALAHPREESSPPSIR